MSEVFYLVDIPDSAPDLREPIPVDRLMGVGELVTGPFSRRMISRNPENVGVGEDKYRRYIALAQGAAPLRQPVVLYAPTPEDPGVRIAFEELIIERASIVVFDAQQHEASISSPHFHKVYVMGALALSADGKQLLLPERVLVREEDTSPTGRIGQRIRRARINRELRPEG